MTMTFTSQPPTVPGAYWWILYQTSMPDLLEVYKHTSGILYARVYGKVVGMSLPEWKGRWSSRLVPVEEVEKLLDLLKTIAPHAENFASHEFAIRCKEAVSHAKQIVDGTKGKESGE